MSDDLKEREEEKRNRCWDPRERWRVLEATIAWVDSQRPVSRNSRQACLANQAHLLGNYGSQLQASNAAQIDTRVD
jgi:hypothetical protein